MTKAGLRIVVMAALSALPSAAIGQVSGTWIGLGTGTWNVGANWTSAPLFPDSGGTAVFGPASSARKVTINPAVTLSTIVFSSVHPDTILGGVANLVGPASIYVAADSSVNWSSMIDGTNGITKQGPGSLLLSSVGNPYAGRTSIDDGTLVVGSDALLGSGSVTLNGGTIRAGAGMTLGRQIFVATGGGTISVTNSAGTSSAISSPITGGGPLTISGDFNSGTLMTNTYGARYLGSADVTGTLSVETRLFLAGSFSSIAAMNAHDTVWLKMTGGGADRIADSATILLRGGSIVTDVHATGNGVERVGAVVVDSTYAVLGDQYLSLRVASIERRGHGVLGIGFSGMQIDGAMPTLSGSGAAGTPGVGILPWAQSESTLGFVFSHPQPLTIDPNGLARRLAASEFATSVNSASLTNSNLFLNASATIPTTIVVNSLTIEPTSTSSLTGSTILLNSGAVYASNPSAGQTRLYAPLDFGAAEGFIHGPNLDNSLVAVYSPIYGSGGLTLTGGLLLAGNSTYTGDTTIHGFAYVYGNVSPGGDGPMGSDSSPVVVEAGLFPYGTEYVTQAASLILSPPAIGSSLFSRDLVFHSSKSIPVGLGVDYHAGAGPVANVSGDIDISGMLSLFGRQGEAGFVVSGKITGDGSLLFPADVTLSGTNIFTGGVRVGSRSVTAGSDAAFGVGTLWISGDGTIAASGGTRVLSNHVSIQANGRIGGSQPITFNGPVDLALGTRSLSIINTATTSFTGSISDGTLTKGGSGRLVLQGVNLDGLRVNEGIIQIVRSPVAQPAVLRFLSIASTGGANLDLTTNDLILDYTGSGATNDASVRSILLGGQLSTSLADTTHGIGYADNSVMGLASFGGVAVDSSSVLFRYTYLGDANLDSIVDARDLGALASHWQSTGMYWTGGDFNYDGTVDIRDLYLLAINWHAGLSQPSGSSVSQTLASLGLPAVEVPEPALMSVLGLCLAAVTKRRRISR